MPRKAVAQSAAQSAVTRSLRARIKAADIELRGIMPVLDVAMDNATRDDIAETLDTVAASCKKTAALIRFGKVDE